MRLDALPSRIGGAAENMAIDSLLLQRYPSGASAVRFRHYGWRRPAATFGYSQKLAWVRSELQTGGSLDLCRRPTGGGIVDHREDWTYALVIPRGHELEKLPAPASYRTIHACLTEVLVSHGIGAVLHAPAAEPEPKRARSPASKPAPAGVCFRCAEIHDVVHVESGVKIAGAAQKRNRHGLLFQGSIHRPALGGEVDWDRFHEDLVLRLRSALGTMTGAGGWPDFDEAELEALIEHYSSPEWLEFR